MIVNRLYTLDEATNEFTTQVAIKFQRGLHTEDDMLRVRQVLGRHPGPIDVVVVIDTADEREPTLRRRFFLALPNTLRVDVQRPAADRAPKYPGRGAHPLPFRSAEEERPQRSAAPFSRGGRLIRLRRRVQIFFARRRVSRSRAGLMSLGSRWILSRLNVSLFCRAALSA